MQDAKFVDDRKNGDKTEKKTAKIASSKPKKTSKFSGKKFNFSKKKRLKFKKNFNR